MKQSFPWPFIASNDRLLTCLKCQSSSFLCGRVVTLIGTEKPANACSDFKKKDFPLQLGPSRPIIMTLSSIQLKDNVATQKNIIINAPCQCTYTGEKYMWERLTKRLI